ncbi:MAG: DUF5939 domain-containing protein, partial [Myxococcota bacterium]|nr:DUF5939 domain-containing protein [Myxococcota bacterium]
MMSVDGALSASTQLHGNRPIVRQWNLVSSASLYDTWALFSDTDRLNEALGLAVEYTEQTRSDGSVRRVGILKKYGIAHRFHEEAYDFEAPSHYRIVRRFENGLIALYQAALQLEVAESGVQIQYVLTIWPRVEWLRPILSRLFSWTVHADLDRTFEAMTSRLAGQASSHDPAPPRLSDAARKKLEQGLEGVEPPRLAQALLEMITHAPLRDQDRIQPLALADELGTEPTSTIKGLLVAVSHGVLQMRWELRCPSCRGPREFTDTLDLDRTVHCEACNIRFDSSIPESVAVSFRTSPDIRTIDIPVLCVSSPSRTPHVLARCDLLSESQVSWALNLDPGNYVLRRPHDPTGTLIEVRPDHDLTRATILLREDQSSPLRVSLCPGPVTLTVSSRLSGPNRVWLEQRPWTDADLTAGQLMELPGVRDLLPEGTLPGTFDVQFTQGALLAVQIFHSNPTILDAVESLLDLPPGTGSPGRLLLVSRPNLEQALDIACRLEGGMLMSSALAEGTFMVPLPADTTRPM